MSTREFKVGQHVFYHSTSRWRAKGPYLVIAEFRQSDGRVRYLIRSEDEPSIEYTATARELRRAAAAREGRSV